MTPKAKTCDTQHKFKSAVMKRVSCPKCGEKYEVFLGRDKESCKGLFICNSSTNKKFANDSGFIWCGAYVAFGVSRSYTLVGMANMLVQPNRFRRVDAA